MHKHFKARQGFPGRAEWKMETSDYRFFNIR